MNLKKHTYINLKNKFLSFFLIIVAISCNSQEQKYIDTNLKIDKNGKNTYTSKTLNDLFNIKNVSYKDIGGTNYDSYSVQEIGIIRNSQQDSQVSKNLDRYILLYNGDILKDTLKIKRNFDFSIYQDKKLNKDRIYVGKYNSKIKYFDVTNIYKINQNIKIEKYELNIDTFCPMPSDYQGEDDGENYKYGIKGNTINKNEIQFENNEQKFQVYEKELLNQFLLVGINKNNILTRDSRIKIEKIIKGYYSEKGFNTEKLKQQIVNHKIDKDYNNILPIWTNAITKLNLSEIIPNDDLPNWKYPYDEVESFKPLLLLYSDVKADENTYNIPYYHLILYTTLLTWKEREKVFEEIDKIKLKIQTEQN